MSTPEAQAVSAAWKKALEGFVADYGTPSKLVRRSAEDRFFCPRVLAVAGDPRFEHEGPLFARHLLVTETLLWQEAIHGPSMFRESDHENGLYG